MAHHLFARMPHYHAKEATRHLKRALGSAYRHDARHVVRDALDGVQYFRAFGT